MISFGKRISIVEFFPTKEGGYAANDTPMATTETRTGMVVDEIVVIGNVEHDQLVSSVETVQANFDVEIERVLADSAYTRGNNLAAIPASCEAFR